MKGVVWVAGVRSADIGVEEANCRHRESQAPKQKVVQSINRQWSVTVT